MYFDVSKLNSVLKESCIRAVSIHKKFLYLTEGKIPTNGSIFIDGVLEKVEDGYSNELIKKKEEEYNKLVKEKDRIGLDDSELKKIRDEIDEAKDLNKLSPKQRAINFLKNGGSTTFPNFGSFGEGFKQEMILSILDNGYYIKDNKFLNYANVVADTSVSALGKKYFTAFEQINKLLNSGDLKIDDLTILWLRDANSYEANDIEYKIKALTFITGKDASAFGEVTGIEKLLNNIIKSKKRSEIEDLLDDWQTKDGSKSIKGKKEPETEEEKKASIKIFDEIVSVLTKGGAEFNKEKLKTAFDMVYKVGDTAEVTLMNIIKSGYLKIRVRRG